ncbi:MAG: nuclear transport factor 2 family protein [Myxococcota bacterium]
MKAAIALALFSLGSITTVLVFATPAHAHGEAPRKRKVSSTERAMLDVVAKRTAAYNKHDIEAFAATYDKDVRVYEYPDKFLGKGVERMKAIFGPQFAAGEGRIVVHRQLVLENTVVSDETVTAYGKSEHNIGVYTIRDGKIVEVRLIEPQDS